ncbi:MAG TPA: ACT domain-containing protein, partial [Vitreimonas sp.]|nr:ACT domain-containing protein [Vitreimonas sp.]
GPHRARDGRGPSVGFAGQGEERRELPRVRRLVLDESDPARLDDYWLDMAPADVMLITRHRDKPGTVGRIGLMLGEADVNISAMHLARTRPREDAFMILALDDDVPPAVADAIRTHEAVLDVWTIRLGGEH